MWRSVVVVGYLSVYPFVCLSVYLSVLLSISICLSASVKRSCSTRLPHFSLFEVDNIKKTQQFCETSSIFELDNIKTRQCCETSSTFELDNIKNAAILRDILQKWKVECRADGLLPMIYQCVLHFFHSICLKYCACHEKVRPGHTKCSTCHAKSSSKPEDPMLQKCNLSQEISARTS